MNATSLFMESTINHISCALGDGVDVKMDHDDKSKSVAITASFTPCSLSAKNEFVSYFRDESQQTVMIQNLMNILSKMNMSDLVPIPIVNGSEFAFFSITSTGTAHDDIDSDVAAMTTNIIGDILSEDSIGTDSDDQYHVFLGIAIVMTLILMMISGFYIFVKCKQSEPKFDRVGVESDGDFDTEHQLQCQPPKHGHVGSEYNVDSMDDGDIDMGAPYEANTNRFRNDNGERYEYEPSDDNDADLEGTSDDTHSDTVCCDDEEDMKLMTKKKKKMKRVIVKRWEDTENDDDEPESRHPGMLFFVCCTC